MPTRTSYDQLGALRLTKRGLALRDRIVLEGCFRRGIPVAPVTAGGYALDPKDTGDIHTNTARECLRVLGQLKPPVKPAVEPGQPGPRRLPSHSRLEPAATAGAGLPDDDLAPGSVQPFLRPRGEVPGPGRL